MLRIRSPNFTILGKIEGNRTGKWPVARWMNSITASVGALLKTWRTKLGLDHHKKNPSMWLLEVYADMILRIVMSRMVKKHNNYKRVIQVNNADCPWNVKIGIVQALNGWNNGNL